MVKQVFLTGATGFLGSHLCYALLREGHRVVALARPAKKESSRDRVVEVLGRVPPSPDGIESLTDRLAVVTGDISQPQLGMDASEYERLTQDIDETWHGAASLSFLEEDREDIFRMNLDGTRHIVEFVAETKGKRLHHLSTAYVAGMRTDLVLEEDPDVGQQFKNPYEESKCRAEVMVQTAQREGRLAASVYRPSIVVGESGTGRTTHFHGVYAFIRGLWAVTQRLRRKQPASDVVELPLRVPGSQSTTLNFVPIDYVTSAMVEVSKQPSSVGKVFHLANPTPTENRLWISVVCDQLRVRGIRLVGEDAFLKTPMTRMEALFDREMAFYYQYLHGEPRFDCSQVLEALQDTAILCPEVTPEFARKMTGWYIDMLNDKVSPATL